MTVKVVIHIVAEYDDDWTDEEIYTVVTENMADGTYDEHVKIIREETS